MLHYVTYECIYVCLRVCYGYANICKNICKFFTDLQIFLPPRIFYFPIFAIFLVGHPSRNLVPLGQKKNCKYFWYAPSPKPTSIYKTNRKGSSEHSHFIAGLACVCVVSFECGDQLLKKTLEPSTPSTPSKFKKVDGPQIC